MKDVTVTALGDFEYRGRQIPVGRVFRMRALDAAIYARQRLISLSRHPSLDRRSLQPDPEAATTVPSKRRRRYRRRDLVADPA